MSVTYHQVPEQHWSSDQTKTISFVAAGTSGTNTIIQTAPSVSTTISIPDTAGAPANFVLSATAQTIPADLTFSGTIDVTGNLLGSVSSSDPVMIVNAAPSTTGNSSGVAGQRYQVDNDSASGDVIRFGQVASGTLQSGSGTSIVLDPAASAVDGFYDEYWIRIIGGPALNEVRQIISYTGASKAATVSSAFTMAPGAAAYFLYAGNFIGLIWDEVQTTFNLGFTPAVNVAEPKITAFANVSTGTVTLMQSDLIFQTASNGYFIQASSPTSFRTYSLYDLQADGNLVAEEPFTYVSNYVDNSAATLVASYSHSVSRKNSTVTITFPTNSGIFASANDGVLTSTALPARFCPISATQSFVALVETGAANTFGLVTVSTAGVLHWQRSATSTTWAGTVNNQFFATSITYVIG